MRASMMAFATTVASLVAAPTWAAPLTYATFRQSLEHAGCHALTADQQRVLCVGWVKTKTERGFAAALYPMKKTAAAIQGDRIVFIPEDIVLDPKLELDETAKFERVAKEAWEKVKDLRLDTTGMIMLHPTGKPASRVTYALGYYRGIVTGRVAKRGASLVVIARPRRGRKPVRLRIARRAGLSRFEEAYVYEPSRSFLVLSSHTVQGSVGPRLNVIKVTEEHLTLRARERETYFEQFQLQAWLQAPKPPAPAVTVARVRDRELPPINLAHVIVAQKKREEIARSWLSRYPDVITLPQERLEAALERAERAGILEETVKSLERDFAAQAAAAAQRAAAAQAAAKATKADSSNRPSTNTTPQAPSRWPQFSQGESLTGTWSSGFGTNADVVLRLNYVHPGGSLSSMTVQSDHPRVTYSLTVSGSFDEASGELVLRPSAQSIQYVVPRSSVPHSGQLQACLAPFRLTRFNNYQLKLEFLGCGGQVFHMMRISG